MHYYSCSERFNFAWAGSLLCDFIPTVATSLCSEKYSLVLDYALLLALQLSYRSWIVAPIALEAVLADNRRNRRQYFSSSFLTTSTVVFFFDLARPRPTSLDLARPRWTSLDLARPRSTPPDLARPCLTLIIILGYLKYASTIFVQFSHQENFWSISQSANAYFLWMLSHIYNVLPEYNSFRKVLTDFNLSV